MTDNTTELDFGTTAQKTTDAEKLPVVLLALDQGKYDMARSLDELRALADANGMDAVAEVVQKRATPEAATLLGEGKVAEARLVCQNVNAAAAIFDVELTGSQFARQDCRIAVIAQEVEVAPQRGDGHGVVCRLRRIFRKVVVFQHVKAPVGRGLCGVSLGRAHRRGKGLGHCAAVEVRRTHGDGLCAARLLKERNGEDDDEHARE